MLPYPQRRLSRGLCSIRTNSTPILRVPIEEPDADQVNRAKVAKPDARSHAAAIAIYQTTHHHAVNSGGARMNWKIAGLIGTALLAEASLEAQQPVQPLVVIDAGHGGVDPGAIGPTNLREKDVTLKVATAIRDELLANGRVRVAMTRHTDRYLTLRDRYSIARRLRGDLFISVHCDSATSSELSGATAYTWSEVASDKLAARVAARENKADVISGVNLGDPSGDESSILVDMAQRKTVNDAANFARMLGREAKPLMPIRPNFHRMAKLNILKAPDIPSVMFELGYFTNGADTSFMESADGRRRIAEAVVRAVDVYFTRLTHLPK